MHTAKKGKTVKGDDQITEKWKTEGGHKKWKCVMMGH